MPLFLVVITAIIVVFQAQILLEVRSELAGLKETIALQNEVFTTDQAMEPFAPLEENCTRCHSERRFAGFHGSDKDIGAMISHMEMNEELELSQFDVDRIHKSIQFLKCVSCHGEENLKTMAGMSSAKRLEVVERMRTKPGANISDEDARAIERAIQNIQGF
ncbi:hypothetical protein KKG66_09230 [bacterium]|nr:hypothetical protein [bacterium]